MFITNFFKVGINLDEGLSGERGVPPPLEKIPKCAQCEGTGFVQLDSEKSLTGFPEKAVCGNCDAADNSQKQSWGGAFK